MRRPSPFPCRSVEAAKVLRTFLSRKPEFSNTESPSSPAVSVGYRAVRGVLYCRGNRLQGPLGQQNVPSENKCACNSTNPGHEFKKLYAKIRPYSIKNGFVHATGRNEGVFRRFEELSISFETNRTNSRRQPSTQNREQIALSSELFRQTSNWPATQVSEWRCHF